MRVLLSGYYGFGNLGDEAILKGLERSLRTLGHEPVALSADPAGTKALHGIRAAHRVRGVLPALLGSGALLSGGGGLLQDKTSRRSLEYYLTLIRLARALGKRVVVYAQSVGPLSERGRAAVAKALKGVPVAVRDEASQRLLAELGIEAALTADASLLLELPQQAIQPDAPVLLIPRAGYPEITSALLGVAKALVATGQPVAAMPIQAGEDGPCLEDMKAQLPALQLWRPQSPQDALEHVARARYVVSGRLHGLIFAAVAHRGFSGLVYDPKVAAFLEEAGAKAHPLPPDETVLLEELTLACPPDAVRLARLKQRAREGIAWLDGVLS